MSTAKTPSRYEKLLALAGLWAVAVPKPVLDVVGQTPEYWPANRIAGATIALLALALTLLPPLLLGGLFALKKDRGFGVTGAAFSAVFAALLTLVLFGSLSRVFGKHVPLLLLSLVASALMAALYWRFAKLRIFFSLYSVMALLVPLAFLLFSPTRSLLTRAEPAEETLAGRVELRAPLVVVIFDELNTPSLLSPEGHIDARLFPNFHRLAQTSTWYQNATTNYGGTEKSVPSLLTGKLQDGAGAGSSYQQNPLSLFTLFSAPDGMLAVEPVTHLCPAELCGEPPKTLAEALRQIIPDFWLIYQNVMVPTRFASRIRPIPQRFRDLAAEASQEGAAPEIADASATIDRLSQWLRQGHDQSLIFLHFGVPHAPYLLNGDGTQYSLAGSYGMPGWIPKEHRWSPEAPFYTTQAFQRYLLQTMYVDQLLGRLMDSLEDSGLFQASTLVVTADHGVAFTPGEKRRALQFDPAVVGANNAVPLLWKSAGQTTAHRETRNIELIDVLPTLLDELGSGADVSGMDGRPVSQPPREVKRFAGQDYAKDVWPEVLETSRARHRAIRIAESREGSYFVRPAKYADLIGQPIDSATPSEQTVELVNPLVLDELKRVDMASSFRPNLIEGTLAADSTVEVVGIAINGLLADVVEVFVDDTGLRRFLSVFDPATLEPGDNPIDFVAVSPVAPEAAATGEAALQRLRHSGDTFRLIDGILSNAEGKPLQRDQERLVGAFDGFDHRIPGVLQIHGWLADRTTWTPPQAYLVVYQDQQHQSRPSRPRPDLTSISEGLVHAGFSTAVRLQGEHFQRDNLRMFVIFDGETYAEMKNIEGMQ